MRNFGRLSAVPRRAPVKKLLPAYRYRDPLGKVCDICGRLIRWQPDSCIICSAERRVC